METVKKQVVVECDCGCSVLKVTKYDWEFDKDSVDYGISLYKDVFNCESTRLRDIIGKRLKNAWFTLMGKDYWLFDICLTQDQFGEFKKDINELE